MILFAVWVLISSLDSEVFGERMSSAANIVDQNTRAITVDLLSGFISLHVTWRRQSWCRRENTLCGLCRGCLCCNRRATGGEVIWSLTQWERKFLPTQPKWNRITDEATKGTNTKKSSGTFQFSCYSEWGAFQIVTQEEATLEAILSLTFVKPKTLEGKNSIQQNKLRNKQGKVVWYVATSSRVIRNGENFKASHNR